MRAFLVNNTQLYKAGYGGVFLSTDQGDIWTAVSAGLTNQNVFALAVAGSNIYAGALGGGVLIRPL
ncbi:MAG: hypothetical protein ACREAM_08840 [Blastocatellia bacterium]